MITLARPAVRPVRLQELPWPVPAEVREHLTGLATREPVCPESFSLCVRYTALAAHEFVFGPARDDGKREALWEDFLERIDGGWSSEHILEWLALRVDEACPSEEDLARRQLARLTAEELER
jgi:hypothetical protein